MPEPEESILIAKLYAVLDAHNNFGGRRIVEETRKALHLIAEHAERTPGLRDQMRRQVTLYRKRTERRRQHA